MSPRPDGTSPSLLARLFDVLCFYPLPLPPPGEPFCRGGIRTQAPGEKGEGRMFPPRNSGPWGNVCRVVLRVSLPCPHPQPHRVLGPFLLRAPTPLWNPTQVSLANPTGSGMFPFWTPLKYAFPRGPAGPIELSGWETSLHSRKTWS